MSDLTQRSSDLQFRSAMVQAVHVPMPELKRENSFDLVLHGAAQVLDCFFVEKRAAITGLSGPKFVIQPIIVFHVEPMAPLWNHAYSFLPAGLPVQSRQAIRPVGAYTVVDPLNGRETIFGLYERQLHPTERVPSNEVLLVQRCAQEGVELDKLSQAQHEAFLKHIVEVYRPQAEALAWQTFEVFS